MRGIEDVFGIIVVASEETSQFDIVQLVKDNIKSNKEFRKANITRLYADKRLALIKKIVLLKTNNNEAQAIGIARTLDQCLNSYKLAFRADIDFVVQFVDYYCEHICSLVIYSGYSVKTSWQYLSVIIDCTSQAILWSTADVGA